MNLSASASQPHTTPLDCLCVGLIVTDLVCAPLVRLPHPGELLVTSALTLSIGGCAANVAVNLTKVGVRVGIAGRIGDDDLGQFARNVLTRNGVETAGLRVTANVQTSATQVVNVQGEDRRFIHATGANACLDGTEIPFEQLQSARVLYVGGFLLNPHWSGEKLRPLLRAAREAGLLTVLDVVLTEGRDHWPDLACVLPDVDIFLPNQDEGRQLTGQNDPLAQAEAFQAAGADTVVITCGGEGAWLLSPTLRLRASTFPTQFVDGTGSGDAFAAGYILGLLRGADAQTCLVLGSALGASCVRAAGATTGVFTAAELEQFLAGQSVNITPL